jgi:hypothetical protein
MGIKLFRLPHLSGKFFLVFTTILAFAALIGVSYYFYNQYQRTQKLLQNPTEAAKAETKFILGQVGKLMDLPTDEDPTIATILDSEKLKDQPFFAKAKNGDKVILYTNARKAILFRPDTNRVIDFAPINIGTPSAQPVTPVRIVLYNGTNIVGLTQTFEKSLKSKATNIEVVGRANAKKTDYGETIVVDLTGTKPELAKQMAELVKGEVSELPDGEVKPAVTADLLVILGNNSAAQDAGSPTPTAKP